ncbi:MAG: hypothetical protein FWD69_09000 [Polyangiaceae bacterium]|nr:hypothetical protein [Polyangiaceae bacterium]
MTMTTTDAYAPAVDPKTLALGQLLTTLAEDAIFGMSCGGGPNVLEGLGKRRSDAYSAVLAGHRLNTMSSEFDPWVVEMTRVMAPIFAPAWMPMSEVIREKVTLEIGARGLRSIFSSKPSDKDVQRVKRLGTLAMRVMRAIFLADGPADVEESRTLAAFSASLGLPEPDAQALLNEGPIPVEQFDVYGDIEPAVARAFVRGAWLAAAWDQIDPREEHVVRVLANKLAIPAMDLEVYRNDVVERIEARHVAGLAAIDAIRFILSDRIPGHGVTLAETTGTLLLPRRFRDEALAPLRAGAAVTLAKRYHLASEDRPTVLAIAWAAAMYEDPSVARRALLLARHDRVAQDIGEDGAKSRRAIEEWLGDVLAAAAAPMSGA